MDFFSPYFFTDFTRMSGTTCATLAQIIPVYFIALLAEDLVMPRLRKRIKKQLRQATLLARWTASMSAFLRLLPAITLAVTLAVLEFALVIGVEIDGYSGVNSVAYWILFAAVTAVVLIRWVVRVSRPLVSD